MITNNSDNITNKQNIKHKSTNKNAMIKKTKKNTKDTKISSTVQYNENTISEVNV